MHLHLEIKIPVSLKMPPKIIQQERRSRRAHALEKLGKKIDHEITVNMAQSFINLEEKLNTHFYNSGITDANSDLSFEKDSHQ